MHAYCPDKTIKSSTSVSEKSLDKSNLDFFLWELEWELEYIYRLLLHYAVMYTLAYTDDTVNKSTTTSMLM